MSIETMSRLTLDDLLEQLEQARQIAIDDRKPSAMIQATATMAKLTGYDRPQLKDVNADAVQTISELMNELANDDQLLTQRISHAKDEY